jgi:hypothetical protein
MRLELVCFFSRKVFKFFSFITAAAGKEETECQDESEMRRTMSDVCVVQETPGGGFVLLHILYV